MSLSLTGGAIFKSRGCTLTYDILANIAEINLSGLQFQLVSMWQGGLLWRHVHALSYHLFNICMIFISQGRLLCHNIWPRRLSDLGRFEQQTLCYPHRQRGAGLAAEMEVKLFDQGMRGGDYTLTI